MPSRRIAVLLALLGVLILSGGAALLFIQPKEAVSVPAAEIFLARPGGSNPEIMRVSAAGAKAAYDQGDAVFVDTRPAEYYAQGHIRGAINMPDESIPAQLLGLPKDTWIITYCT